MAYQGHFLLSGPALPAGVDWGEVRADSLAYKESRKQAHIVATGGTPAPPGPSRNADTGPPRAEQPAAWLGSQSSVWLVGPLGSSLTVPSQFPRSRGVVREPRF